MIMFLKMSFFIYEVYIYYGDFDAASGESHMTSFTVAGVCSGCRWFAPGLMVMHRSQDT